MALKDMKSIYSQGVRSASPSTMPIDFTGWHPTEDVFPYGLWSDRNRTKLRKSNYSL